MEGRPFSSWEKRLEKFASSVCEESNLVSALVVCKYNNNFFSTCVFLVSLIYPGELAHGSNLVFIFSNHCQ